MSWNQIKIFIFRLKEAGEIVIKTMSDYWIVGKLSNLREFFVVIQQKNASIIEIDGKIIILLTIKSRHIIYKIIKIIFSDEVKRLCEQQLKSIFFH